MEKQIWSLAEREAEFRSGINGPKFEECEPRVYEFVARFHPRPSEEQALHIACMEGDLNTVKRMATEIPRLLLEQDANGLFPIHTALVMGHIEIVDFLIDTLGPTGILPWLLDKRNDGVIHLAAYARATRIIKRLVEEFGFNITDGPDSRSPNRIIHIAALTGNLPLLKYLVEEMPERGVVRRALLTDKNQYSELPIFTGLMEDRLEIFIYCIQRNPEVLDQKDADSLPLFWSAVRWGATSIVAYMIENGMVGKRDSKESEGSNPKSEQGEEDPYMYDGNDVVTFAINNGCLHLLKWLKSTGWDLKNIRNVNNTSAIHCACIYGYIEIVKFLVEETTLDPFAIDKDNRLPIVMAAQEGKLDIVQYLYGIRLRGGQDDPLERRQGGPVSHRELLITYALRCGNIHVAEWLVSSGINEVNHQDPDGFTPLMYAAETDFTNSVEWLLEHGADPHIRHPDPGVYSTATWFALEHGKLSCLQLFHEHDPSLIWQPSDELDLNPMQLALLRGHVDVCKWLMSIDPRKDELEQYTGKSGYIWPDGPMGSQQPVWNWHYSGCNDQPKLVVNPRVNAILNSMISDQNEENDVWPANKSIEWLISLGMDFDTNMTLEEGASEGELDLPLSRAVQVGNLGAVKLLIEKAELMLFSDTYMTYSNDNHILHVAASGGHAEILRYLLNKIKEIEPEFPLDEPVSGWSLLASAAHNGYWNTFKLLYDDYGSTLLHYSEFSNIWQLVASGGSVEIWKCLETKFELRFKPETDGPHVLQLAIRKENTDLIYFLIDEVKIPLNGSFWLGFAIGEDTPVEKLEGLYARGFSVTTTDPPDDDTNTAMHKACLYGNFSVVKWLHRLGVSIFSRDSYSDGMTPLHYACQEGYLDIAKWLVAHGAPVSVKCDGETPRDSAAASGHVSVVAWFDAQGLL